MAANAETADAVALMMSVVSDMCCLSSHDI